MALIPNNEEPHQEPRTIEQRLDVIEEILKIKPEQKREARNAHKQLPIMMRLYFGISSTQFVTIPRFPGFKNNSQRYRFVNIYIANGWLEEGPSSHFGRDKTYRRKYYSITFKSDGTTEMR